MGRSPQVARRALHLLASLFALGPRLCVAVNQERARGVKTPADGPARSLREKARRRPGARARLCSEYHAASRQRPRRPHRPRERTRQALVEALLAAARRGRAASHRRADRRSAPACRSARSSSTSRTGSSCSRRSRGSSTSGFGPRSARWTRRCRWRSASTPSWRSAARLYELIKGVRRAALLLEPDSEPWLAGWRRHGGRRPTRSEGLRRRDRRRPRRPSAPRSSLRWWRPRLGPPGRAIASTRGWAPRGPAAALRLALARLLAER